MARLAARVTGQSGFNFGLEFENQSYLLLYPDKIIIFCDRIIIFVNGSELSQKVAAYQYAGMGIYSQLCYMRGKNNSKGVRPEETFMNE
ncbi:LOW QUALITY PROTEIN: hypothetical protein M8C21_004704 [Ambrosia artemisiifolia]|uniref:Uncharacterized protein n=1 Tax=Ambrosia artemisiifolia TaxID=4212 RepID=A0AAD5CDW7_AMBAR|nr:LOW QUALITY PROTEIN: hypothetical protein M8C21_004704 [Ambrosia artemisiifolia]